MTENELKMYNAIYANSLMFLKRGIKEILSFEGNSEKPLDIENGVMSSLFVQMSIELAIKAFLVKQKGVRSILEEKYNKKTDEEIFTAFINNSLKTERYEDLKNILINNPVLTWFEDEEYDHLKQFQLYRNKIVHFNLFLDRADLLNLKFEIIYVVVHIIVPLLSDISFEYETPTSFYNECLDKNEYKKLISFPPYVKEMEKLAIENNGTAYYCPECYKKTYSPAINLCYCCNLNYSDAVEYTNCPACDAHNSVIFDPLNIELNNNVMNALCLNCDTKMSVFRCPKCEEVYPFFLEDELDKCNDLKCHYDELLR